MRENVWKNARRFLSLVEKVGFLKLGPPTGWWGDFFARGERAKKEGRVVVLIQCTVWEGCFSVRKNTAAKRDGVRCCEGVRSGEGWRSRTRGYSPGCGRRHLAGAGTAPRI